MAYQEMKPEQIDPRMLAIHEHRFSPKIPNSEQPKNQNCYRLMAMLQGKAAVEIGGVVQDFEPNDVLYLVPGATYRILNTYGARFAVLNMWFSYGRDEVRHNVAETVFQPRFRPELSVPTYLITSAPHLCTPMLLKNNGHLCLLLQEIQKNAQSLQESGVLRVRADLLRAIAILIDEAAEIPSAKQRAGNIIAYIRAHIEERLEADTLAEHFHYHKNYIGTLIKKETGFSLRQFILNEKIRIAQQWMQETDLSLTEIAARLSFYDYSHFYKQMKKQQRESE